MCLSDKVSARPAPRTHARKLADELGRELAADGHAERRVGTDLANDRAQTWHVNRAPKSVRTEIGNVAQLLVLAGRVLDELVDDHEQPCWSAE